MQLMCKHKSFLIILISIRSLLLWPLSRTLPTVDLSVLDSFVGVTILICRGVLNFQKTCRYYQPIFVTQATSVTISLFVNSLISLSIQSVDNPDTASVVFKNLPSDLSGIPFNLPLGAHILIAEINSNKTTGTGGWSITKFVEV
jgi:hypothetical protein